MGYLVLDHIAKRFGTREVLRDITLDIDAGAFCVILGPSGCGKSTLLNIVAGLEEPTEGRVILDGRDITALPPHRRDIAMVFQNYALYPHLSVYENIAFGLRVRRLPDEEIKKRVTEVSRVLNIGHTLDSLPRQLSGGERQRVATGRAIVRDPSLFLFDEPLSNLDARLRLEVRKEFLSLQRRLHTTSLYVTHDQIEALSLGDMVVVIKDAVIQQIAPPKTLFEDPDNLFVAEFIGTPPMNIIEGEIRMENSTMSLVTGDFRLEVPPQARSPLERYDGTTVFFGIRPSAIHCAQNGYEGEIMLTEMLGEESLLYVRLSEGIEVRVMGPGSAGSGKRVHLRLDPQRMYFFDRNGTRIR
ncbi:MAG: ABC transporter ATP-binding protein [bacterium]